MCSWLPTSLGSSSRASEQSEQDDATHDYQIGDTVDVSPSCAWPTGGRGTIVEIDDDEGNFTPVCVECEGQRWWVAAGHVKRVESEQSRAAVSPLDEVSTDLFFDYYLRRRRKSI